MGNVEQGKNECGPAGVANSMHWLKAVGDIDLDGDTPAQSLQKLKSDMPGFSNESGVGQEGAIQGKLKFAQRTEHPLNLDIKYQADAGLTDLGASVTDGAKTATRVGMGGKPTFEFLKQQMQNGEDVELSIDWLNSTGVKTGGHVVVVSGLIEIGNFRAISINDDDQKGPGGLRTNHWVKIEDEGGYMKLGGINRNRVKAIYVESKSSAVGGIAEVVAASSGSPASPAAGSGSSDGLYAALAAAGAVVVLAAAGGWYTRRRWLR